VTSPRPKVLLKRGRANPVWRGHPWVYSGSVDKTQGKFEPGEVVEVCDVEHRLIGVGFANPRSQILVRMLTRGPLEAEAPIQDLGDAGGGAAVHAAPTAATIVSTDPLAALIHARLEAARLLRRRLGLPSDETNAFRLVNSEGDGLPGLVVDVYGEVAAVQFTALGMKLQEAAVFESLRRLPLGLAAIVEVGAGSFAQVEGFTATTRVVWSDGTFKSKGEVATTGVACRENGVTLRVDLEQGQKTGLFLDQRENRLRLGRYSRGADVLDVYSYVGGFALSALRQGARSATCVDSSARALERAQRHAAENQLGPLETVEEDAFRYLEAVTPYRYDVVVVDPPKFARNQRDLPAALKGYQRLNALALNAVKRGGLFATCSCSQLVDEESFERMVAAAAQDAGRRVTIVEAGSQAPDHPVPPAFPEGRYLKFLLLGVD
jgi:23S rRNA (cytosine1962-C5)-methyltransferase